MRGVVDPKHSAPWANVTVELLGCCGEFDCRKVGDMCRDRLDKALTESLPNRIFVYREFGDLMYIVNSGI